MPDRWEYKMLVEKVWSAGFKDRQGNEYQGFNEATLNGLGEEGWEVCAYSDRLRTLILKRRRVSPPD